MAERIYSGELASKVTVREGGEKRPLQPRADIGNRSTQGFGWGEATTGRAQLAVALLADALGSDARALRLHDEFGRRVLTNLPDRWTITRSRIIAHVDMIELERNHMLDSVLPSSSGRSANLLDFS